MARRPTPPSSAPVAPTRSAPAGLLLLEAGGAVDDAEVLLLDDVPVLVVLAALVFNAFAACWNASNDLFAVGLIANTMPLSQ